MSNAIWHSISLRCIVIHLFLANLVLCSLSLAFPVLASENYICLPQKIINAEAGHPKRDEEVPHFCDFKNDEYYFEFLKRYNKETTKRQCEAMYGEKVHKLEIRQDELEYFNSSISILFQRRNNSEGGITGIQLDTKDQFQRMLMFSPFTKVLTAVRLNPILGVHASVLKCYGP